MKLSQFDRDLFSNEIHDILQGFGTTITFIDEKPIYEQENYNPILQEMTGTAEFTEYNVPAMRYDYQSDMEDVNTMDSRKYGDRREAILCYKVSRKDCASQSFKPLATMDVIIDDSGELYYIEKIAKRIGEYLVWIRRYPNGTEKVYSGLTKIPGEDW